MKISTLKDPAKQTNLDAWGTAPGRLEGELNSSGRILRKGPNDEAHCGLWVCSPGKFECNLEKDEFFYFLEGDAEYVSDEGEVTTISPDMAAFFPKGWKGVCTVREELKSVYMIP